jgi:putative secretion ATPase (PEP-CTERM system associated)
MYESHFGLTGPPFQLNPDPSFYFGSRGHSNALAYLKFGAHQGEGFIVVTGEVGAGKTTLVRALLAGLDPAKVVAAQVVNTQLQSGELLQSILAAFGVSPLGNSKAMHIATLEGFLTALAAKGRRALLVVDEAQNLNREAIEELRMLSNFQLGNHALLQSFLVGQPELRQQLESPAMEQLRQRVIASCHLGPLDVAETRAYIEHRLKHVGWTNKPRFADESFERIHAWTNGIPRRINLLCNRILLSVFLNGDEEIDVELVEERAGDLHHETGSRRSARHPVASGPEDAKVDGDLGEPDGTRSPIDEAASSVERVGQFEMSAPNGTILCVAEEALAWTKLVVLGRAMSMMADMPRLVLVNPGPRSALAGGARAAMVGVSQLPEVHLCVEAADVAEASALVALRFGALVREMQPVAVMPVGSSNAILGCALLAHQVGLPVLRPGAGEERNNPDAAQVLNSCLIDRFADVLYTRAPKSHYALYKEGLLAERMVPVGNLGVDVIAELAPPSHEAVAHYLSNSAPLAWQRRAAKGYTLVTAQLNDADLGEGRVKQLVSALHGAAKEHAVLWPADDATARILEDTGSLAPLALDGVCIVPAVDYIQLLQLLRGTELVIAGPQRIGVEEAVALGTPVVVVHPGSAGPSKSEQDGVVRVGLGSPQCAKTIRDARRRSHGGDTKAAVPRAAEAIATHIARWNERRRQAAATTSDHPTIRVQSERDESKSGSPRKSAPAKDANPKPVAPVR